MLRVAWSAAACGHGWGSSIQPFLRFRVSPALKVRPQISSISTPRLFCSNSTTCGSQDSKEKKTWTPVAFLKDHVAVGTSLPKILDAYVGPNSIAPKLNESIMVTVNSVNRCPYCTGLHVQLARMAGVEDAEKLEKSTSSEEARKVVDEPAVSFARVFAENGGRGDAVDVAFQEISDKYGAGKASSIRALCWFLQWGSLGGNTLNAILAGTYAGPAPFKVVYVLYYGPLFFVIAVMNRALVFFPTVPTFVSATIGVVLTFAGGSWILPPAFVGLVSSLLL